MHCVQTWTYLSHEKDKAPIRPAPLSAVKTSIGAPYCRFQALEAGKNHKMGGELLSEIELSDLLLRYVPSDPACTVPAPIDQEKNPFHQDGKAAAAQDASPPTTQDQVGNLFARVKQNWRPRQEQESSGLLAGEGVGPWRECALSFQFFWFRLWCNVHPVCRLSTLF